MTTPNPLRSEKTRRTDEFTGRRVQQAAKGQFTSAPVSNSFSNKTHLMYESLYHSLSSHCSAQR